MSATILLVEDEPLIRMLATDHLQDAGFQVDTAIRTWQTLYFQTLIIGVYIQNILFDHSSIFAVKLKTQITCD